MDGWRLINRGTQEKLSINELEARSYDPTHLNKKLRNSNLHLSTPFISPIKIIAVFM